MQMHIVSLFCRYFIVLKIMFLVPVKELYLEQLDEYILPSCSSVFVLLPSMDICPFFKNKIKNKVGPLKCIAMLNQPSLLEWYEMKLTTGFTGLFAELLFCISEPCCDSISFASSLNILKCPFFSDGLINMYRYVYVCTVYIIIALA